MSEVPNVLQESGRPLAFLVDETQLGHDLTPPNRHGQSTRTSVRSLTIFQKEALVTSALTGKTWRLSSDEGPYLDGTDYGPPPLAYLTVGMVASYMEEIQALAKIRGIELRYIRLIQDNFYSMTGSALRGTMVADAHNIDLIAEIDSNTDKSTLTHLVSDAVAASPLNGLMRGVNESLFTLNHNSQEIPVVKVGAVDGAQIQDPLGTFTKVGIINNPHDNLITRIGLTPPIEDSYTRQGMSLEDHQDRRLHLRGICTLREDGVKIIEEHLFNPHGTMFTFLSDEHGRAPDAASLISAGIAFCFMTQFGRYAKIAKKDLKSYRVTQDAYFSLGGASGGTGKPGHADPLETHVFLETGEDNAFATLALDMAEQTCFLHAFCRTDLKARVKINTVSTDVT
jgi:organic hydroperoxide reductase OsmC/OhrA